MVLMSREQKNVFQNNIDEIFRKDKFFVDDGDVFKNSLRIYLARMIQTEESCIGILHDGETRICYTLEDPTRDKKIYGKTAIQADTYEVVLYKSKNFGEAPKLLDVSNYTDILMHWGCYAKNTDGCILTGKIYQYNMILETKKVFSEKVLPKIKSAIVSGKRVFITITDKHIKLCRNLQEFQQMALLSAYEPKTLI